MSAVGRALSEALERPNEWAYEGYTITHVPSGLVFWIANGAFFFDGYPNEGTPSCLGLVERHWLWHKARPMVRAFEEHAAREAEVDANSLAARLRKKAGIA